MYIYLLLFCNLFFQKGFVCLIRTTDPIPMGKEAGKIAHVMAVYRQRKKQQQQHQREEC